MQVSFIDLEEPVTKEDQKEIRKALADAMKNGVGLDEVLFRTKQVNSNVELVYNEKYVGITNTKGGTQTVFLKARTFDKIAKELGYVRK